MNFAEKVKEVRTYRGLTGEEFGNVVGLSKQALSMIENEKRGVSPELIFSICNNFDIDVRYFYNQLDSIEDGDLRKNRLATTDTILRELAEIKRKVQPSTVDTVDPVALSVLENPELYECVSMLKNERDDVIHDVKQYAVGYIAAMKTIRERAG